MMVTFHFCHATIKGKPKAAIQRDNTRVATKIKAKVMRSNL